MGDENCNRIDQAAAVLTSRLHQGDNGREARDLLAFDANTMGKADYTAMIQQVQTTEALAVNDLMRSGRHDEAVNRLREDAMVFGNGEEFMELAGEVRAMNKATRSPSHLEFDNIYQQGDRYGQPTAVEVGVKTTFESAQTGQQYEKKGVVTIVDNHTPTDANCQPPQRRDVVIIEPPPPPPIIVDGRGGRGPNIGVGIGIDNRGGFSFDLEIEIGRERVRRHDPRWCPDNNWRPYNAPPNFNLEIEINRTRDDHRRRGDHDWEPRRETPRTVINQINNTTIINNNTKIDSHDTVNSNNRTRTETNDNSNSNNRTRTETRENNNNRTRETTTPPRGEQPQPRRPENDRHPETVPPRGDQSQPRKPENDRRPPQAERPAAPPAAAPDRPAPQERQDRQQRGENPRNDNQRDNGDHSRADQRRAEAEKMRQQAQEQREQRERERQNNKKK